MILGLECVSLKEVVMLVVLTTAERHGDQEC